MTTWMEVLISIIGIVLTAFVSWGIERLISWLNTKIDNEKVASLLTSALETVETCVKSTYQTYVETLKEEGSFDAEAQKTALNKALDEIKETLSEEATKYIEENFGDLDEWIATQIEAAIYTLKN